ncbi:sterol desaturase family protein [Candidatus Laterigemmans baculatus]|uniref:sterol desaturase family protein n=1 Tax=Candidatus Laterigemmans baculatus TaxID=2770505 RepID=UPI0013DD5233|nr:sterol desaturase family protein [Candidatus Laterigemmans baculatus]
MSVSDKLTHTFRAGMGGSLSQLIWYALLACGVWLFFYILFRSHYQTRRIGRNNPLPNQIPREILCSFRSIVLFGIVTAGVVYAAYSGWTRLYVEVDEYGWGWFAGSIVLMIILHDAYFYWTHRLMHHRRLYRWMHHTHHRSINPTPWAAYAFSPAEAFVQAGIGPLVVFIMPVHPAAFSAFMIWQITFNVFGHCGYEIYPQWFLKSRLGMLLNSVTHHTLHHENFHSNFGLYFNVWDRILKTNHPDYEPRFELATRKLPNSDDMR